jgi:DNA polymerase-3 subunit beta
MTDIDLEFPKSDECEFIMPFKCVSELSRLIGDEGDVRLLVSDSNIGLEIGSIRLISKRVDGTYPNYKQVIPTEVRERVKIERQPFIEALRRVSLLESDRNHSVKFTLSKNTMIISSVATDIGEAREELTVDYKGRDMVISFNPDFVMDPLRALPDEVVNIDLVDEMSAAAVKVESPFLYVMMPMRS